MAKEATTPIELLQNWDHRALKALDAHYESARRYWRINKRIGIPTVVLATIIIGLAFSTVGRVMPLWVQMSIGFLSVAQAVLAALHTWLRYSEIADKHRLAGARYAAVRRKIEQVRVIDSEAMDQATAITEIRNELDALGREAPSIPPKIWKLTQVAYRGHGTANGTILAPTIPK